MKELFLSAPLAGDKLNIIDEKNVYRPIAFAENLRLVIPVPYRIDKFVHKALKRKVGHLKFWVSPLDCMAGGLDQRALIRTDTTIKIQWVIGLSWSLGSGLRRGMREPVAGSDNESREPIFL